MHATRYENRVGICVGIEKGILSGIRGAGFGLGLGSRDMVKVKMEVGFGIRFCKLTWPKLPLVTSARSHFTGGQYAHI